VVGISVDTECAKAQEVADHKALPWPVVCEGKGMQGSVPRLYNVRGTPTYYLIDREGRIEGKKISGQQIEGALAKVFTAGGG